MVSTLGLLDGISATGVVLNALLMGLFCIIRAKKPQLRVLLIAGLMTILAGFLWLGPTLEFFSVLLTNNSISPKELYSLISYCWVAPLLVCGLYIGLDLLFPSRKKILLMLYTGLGIAFELFIFLDTAGSFKFIDPAPGDLLDSQFQTFSPAFFQ